MFKDNYYSLRLFLSWRFKTNSIKSLYSYSTMRKIYELVCESHWKWLILRQKRGITQSVEQCISGEGVKGTIINWTYPFINSGSVKISFTVPLRVFFLKLECILKFNAGLLSIVIFSGTHCSMVKKRAGGLVVELAGMRWSLKMRWVYLTRLLVF